MNTDPTCPLCRLEKKTRWYLEDPCCRIVKDDNLDGAIARIMVVPKVHGKIPQELRRYCIKRLKQIANRFVGPEHYGRGYTIESRMRRVRNHWHAHARFKRKESKA